MKWNVSGISSQKSTVMAHLKLIQRKWIYMLSSRESLQTRGRRLSPLVRALLRKKAASCNMHPGMLAKVESMDVGNKQNLSEVRKNGWPNIDQMTKTACWGAIQGVGIFWPCQRGGAYLGGGIIQQREGWFIWHKRQGFGLFVSSWQEVHEVKVMFVRQNFCWQLE